MERKIIRRAKRGSRWSVGTYEWRAEYWSKFPERFLTRDINNRSAEDVVVQDNLVHVARVSVVTEVLQPLKEKIESLGMKVHLRGGTEYYEFTVIKEFGSSKEMWTEEQFLAHLDLFHDAIVSTIELGLAQWVDKDQKIRETTVAMAQANLLSAYIVDRILEDKAKERIDFDNRIAALKKQIEDLREELVATIKDDFDAFVASDELEELLKEYATSDHVKNGHGVPPVPAVAGLIRKHGASYCYFQHRDAFRSRYSSRVDRSMSSDRYISYEDVEEYLNASR